VWLLLRVLFDATAVPSDRRGVGRYIDSLIPALAGLPDGPEIQVVCRPADVDHYSELAGREALAASPLTDRRPTRLLWEQTGLAALARRSRADVLHCPHYTMPVAASLPTVVTLHDATFFSDPQLHTLAKRYFFTAATRHAIRRASELIVPSAATRAELVRLVSSRAERATVAHLAVDTDVFHPPSQDEVAALRAELGLSGDQPYIAFLGTIEPRKNIPNLIRGWIASCRDRADPPALVIAGGSGWDDTVDRVAAEVPDRLRLIRPGYLPLESLPALLGGAAVSAYPSLGEGFGLPVLEAMACGAAVLTTRRLALPEVGGDAVAYTDVDAGSIATALGLLLDDPARRAELGRLGVARAARFSWAESAAVHAQAYRRAAGRPHD
jgi:glycosyltransferase involved in cell wall biosynthesis